MTKWCSVQSLLFFCNTIRVLAPVLLSLRNEGMTADRVSGPYQNTVKLYDRWASRLKKEQLDSQAAKLNEQSSGIHITEMPVRGLEQLLTKSK
jgi:hypothetical protein